MYYSLAKLTYKSNYNILEKILKKLCYNTKRQYV